MRHFFLAYMLGGYDIRCGVEIPRNSMENYRRTMNIESAQDPPSSPRVELCCGSVVEEAPSVL
jgi:hypothetical protein